MSGNKLYFLERVAERLLSIYENYETAVIVPNRRAAMYIKKHISARIDKPIFLPPILTIEDFLTDMSGLIKTDSIQQLIYLFRAYQELKIGSDHFDQFLSWGPTFIKDCNDIDNSLVDPARFFEELYEDRKLRNWELEQELTTMQKEYLHFWKEAHHLYERFIEIMKQQGKAYMALIYKIALQTLEETNKLPYDKILFVGFNALNEAEKKLFDFCINKGIGEIWWDWDGYYVYDNIQKAGDYFRKYAQEWNIPTDQLQTDLGYQLEQINIIEAPNNTGQTEVAYNIIQNLNIDHNQLSKTAIILTDETLLDVMLLRLPSNIPRYNITMGKPLSQFPEFHLFEQFLNFFQEANAEGYNVQSIISLSASPLFKILDTDHRFIDMLADIKQNNVFILSHQQAKIYDKGIWKLLTKTHHSLRDILETLQRVILRLRAHFLKENNKQAVEVLFEFRNIFNQLDSVIQENVGLMTINSLRRFYKQVCQQIKLPFEGEPLEGVQIMGLLESRCLDFEHVIILSANEGMLPESKHSQTFIPHLFREHFNMPTYNERDSIFAYSFYRLFHQAKRIDIIYNGSTSSTSGEKSRYVQQIEAEYPQKANPHTSINLFNSKYPKGHKVSFDYIIEKSPKVIEDIKKFIVEKSFSPSSLNTLIRSPLDFYFTKIARIREHEELEVEIENNTFGTIVHDTLEELYKPYKNKVLTEEILNEILNKYPEELEQQFISVYKQGNTEYGYNLLLRNGASIMIEETIALDLRRIKKHKITLLDVEKNITALMELPIEGEENLTIKLLGKIDRIQKRDDDVIEIIDYKTGVIEHLQASNLNSVGNNYKADKYLQLMIYTYLTANNIDGNSYELERIRPALQGLRSWQKGLTFLESQNFIIQPEHINQLKSNLAKVFDSLLDLEVPFQAETKEDRYKYSNYKSIYQSI